MISGLWGVNSTPVLPSPAMHPKEPAKLIFSKTFWFNLGPKNEINVENLASMTKSIFSFFLRDCGWQDKSKSFNFFPQNRSFFARVRPDQFSSVFFTSEILTFLPQDWDSNAKKYEILWQWDLVFHSCHFPGFEPSYPNTFTSPGHWAQVRLVCAWGVNAVHTLK